MPNSSRGHLIAPLALAAVTLPIRVGVGLASNAGESGNVCVSHYVANANCTSNDVIVENVVVKDLIDGCNGPADTATVRLDVSLWSPVAHRWDIGVFVATDGGSARDGSSCYHDYLAPPLTATPAYVPSQTDSKWELYNGPWLDSDGDTCGDMDGDFMSSRTRLIMTLPSPTATLTLACTDPDNNGTLDVDVCVGWHDQDTIACNAVSDAFPNTASRCYCAGPYDLGVPILGATTTTSTTTTNTITTTTTTTTTTTVPASAHFPVPARLVTIKPDRVFKIVASGDFGGPVDDPTVDGATLTFSGSTGGQTYALPPSCWTAGSTGYVCHDVVCTTVRVRPGLVKAVCKFDTGTFTVPNDGDVDVVLTIGDNSSYCATCGGTTGGNPATTYTRKDCAAPPNCP